MSLTDIFILLLIIMGVIYGVLRGVRPALFLFTAFLASILGVMLLTIPFERLILDLSGIGADQYPDAPAVAVLILEGKSSNAYLASFIPTMLVFFFLLALVIGGMLLKPFIRDASTGMVSRLLGGFCGLCAGLTAGLLVILQLSRLPWPMAGTMFKASLIIETLNHFASPLIAALSGAF